MAIENQDIQEVITAMPVVGYTENVDDIELIQDILEYDSYDYIIVNALLSSRKIINLADYVDHMYIRDKPKIIVLLDDMLDKKFITQLVGLSVYAFVTFQELNLVSKYIENYPESFSLSSIDDLSERRGITTNTIINGTISIGVFNLDHGAGSTTCSLNLAEEIANCGYRVICVEIDETNFQFVKKKPKNLELISTTSEEKDMILQIAFSDNTYQFIIIDFGKIFNIDLNGELISLNQTIMGDFLRCNYKIGMSFSSAWHNKKIEAILKNNVFYEDLVKGQIFLLVSGLMESEAIEDYHEITIFSREDKALFYKHFMSIVGIHDLKQKKRSIFNKFRRKGY
ncbi:MAG: hypothetical protein ACK5MV_13270 [Aminipila sp.]